MVGWHHPLDGHEFEQAPRAGDGQRSLAGCSPRGRRESDTDGLRYSFRGAVFLIAFVLVRVTICPIPSPTPDLESKGLMNVHKPDSCHMQLLRQGRIGSSSNPLA